MANSDKNIIIRPRTGDNTNNPVLELIGASSTVGPQTITVEVSSADQGTVTFSGASGTLLTLADNATSKLSVNGSMSSTGGFIGDLTGNADTASAWETARTITLGGDFTGSVSVDGSANVTLTGTVDATSANTANKIVKRDASGNFSAGTITASLSGNATTATTATNVTAVANNSTSEIVYVTFVDGTTGAQGIETDTGLTYNPSSNILTATTFNGDLSGNATTASAWQTARTITLGGVLSGSVSINGSADVTLTAAHTSDPVITLTGAVTGSGTMTNLGSVSITTTTTADPTLTLAGDATGSATFTNLGNATLTVAVVDDSHAHSFNNLLNKTSGTGNYTTTGTFTAATFNATSTTNGGFQGINADTITTPSFTWTSDLNTGMWHPAADQIGFTTGGTSRLNISTTAITSTLNISAPIFTGDLSGNATTATTLQNARTINGVSFNGSGNITVESYIENDDTTNATRYLTFVDNTTASFKRLNEDSNLTYNPGTNTLSAVTFSGALSGNATTATTWQTARTLTLSGAVTGSVSINGSGNVTLATTATSDPTLTLSGDATGSATFTNLGNATLTVAVVDDSHAHSFNNLLNKTSGTGNYTTTGTFTAAIIAASDGTSAAPGIRFSSDTNTGFYRSATDAVSVTTGGTLAATFEADGDFVATGDVTAFSDRRLKTNINTVEGALDLVNQLRGVRFEKGGRIGIGVIAQEIEEILPEVVNNSGEYKSVAYGNIVGVLIEAIKELSAEIEELKKDRQ